MEKIYNIYSLHDISSRESFIDGIKDKLTDMTNYSRDYLMRFLLSIAAQGKVAGHMGDEAAQHVHPRVLGGAAKPQTAVAVNVRLSILSFITHPEGQMGVDLYKDTNR